MDNISRLQDAAPSGRVAPTRRPMSALRIYFGRGETISSGRVWIFPTRIKLKTYIIELALRAGLANVFYQEFSSGFVGGKMLQSEYSDTYNTRIPACLELVDTRARLEAFCESNRGLLAGRLVTLDSVDALDCGPA